MFECGLVLDLGFRVVLYLGRASLAKTADIVAATSQMQLYMVRACAGDPFQGRALCRHYLLCIYSGVDGFACLTILSDSAAQVFPSSCDLC